MGSRENATVKAQNATHPPIVSLNSFFEKMVEPFFNILLSPCDVLCPLFTIYSKSIYMVVSWEGFREGLQPSLNPVVQIYTVLKSSFVAVFADREAIADGLNPLTISHTARVSS